MTRRDEVKEAFYEDLSKAIKQVPYQDKPIVLGDFSDRVRADSDTWSRMLGHHSIGQSNSNSQLLLSQ